MQTGQRIGSYVLLAPLGRGGMCDVFLAQRTGAGDFRLPVCIKFLNDEMRDDRRVVDMFLDEARILSQLRDKNVVAIQDYAECEGQCFLVMEYSDGCDLAALIRAARRDEVKLSIALVVHVLRSVAAGLLHAHEHRDHDGTWMKIVHRDVSPANVLINRDGDVKLSDFGVARSERQRHLTTTTSTAKGKPCYMPPEQWIGTTVVDARADLFALGVVLFEMLTLSVPFVGDNMMATKDLIDRGVRKPVDMLRPDTPGELVDLVDRLLQPDRDERPSSASEILEVTKSLWAPTEAVAELKAMVARETEALSYAAARAATPPDPSAPPAEAATQPGRRPRADGLPPTRVGERLDPMPPPEVDALAATVATTSPQIVARANTPGLLARRRAWTVGAAFVAVLTAGGLGWRAWTERATHHAGPAVTVMSAAPRPPLPAIAHSDPAPSTARMEPVMVPPASPATTDAGAATVDAGVAPPAPHRMGTLAITVLPFGTIWVDNEARSATGHLEATLEPGWHTISVTGPTRARRRVFVQPGANPGMVFGTVQ